MAAVVFIGPTITEPEVHSVVDAVCLPPAAQGDIYRAMEFNPKCIGIIDGYFDGVASVWHKEILWAMSQGVHVFGASSMGALRAAELSAFGMQGVGEIFRQYNSGELEDDDEVAVIHGPPEIGYPPLSEPMVSIRATLDQAVVEKVLTKRVAAELCVLAKQANYRVRSWEAVLVSAQEQALEAQAFDRFADWLKENAIDQKKQDAVAMLEAVRELMNTDGIGHEASFEFEWTNLWHRASAQWHLTKPNESGLGEVDINSILNELRLLPDEFVTYQDAAKLRYLALSGATHPVWRPDQKSVTDKITSFRQQHNLLTRASLDRWLEQNDLTSEALREVLEGEIYEDNAVDVTSPEFLKELIIVLKLGGKYHTLAERARSKIGVLGKGSAKFNKPQDIGMQGVALVNWYFRQVLERDIPQDIDMHVREVGLTSRKEFYQLLVQEHCYLHSGAVESKEARE